MFQSVLNADGTVDQTQVSYTDLSGAVWVISEISWMWLGIYQPWLDAGGVVTAGVLSASENPEQVLITAVQLILDAKAQAYRYDSILAAVSYSTQTVSSQFQNEGVAFGTWRAQVWAAAYAYLAEVEAGTKAMPAVADLPGLLPAFSLDAQTGASS